MFYMNNPNFVCYVNDKKTHFLPENNKEGDSGTDPSRLCRHTKLLTKRIMFCAIVFSPKRSNSYR